MSLGSAAIGYWIHDGRTGMSVFQWIFSSQRLLGVVNTMPLKFWDCPVFGGVAKELTGYLGPLDSAWKADL